MSIKITVEHNGTRYTGETMTIERTTLGVESHGIVTASLHCRTQGSGISVAGGYCLDDKPDKTSVFGDRRTGSAYGLDFIMRILWATQVSTWEQLPGKPIIVLFPEGNGGWGGTAVGISSLDGSRVLIFAEHADLWLQEASA